MLGPWKRLGEIVTQGLGIHDDAQKVLALCQPVEEQPLRTALRRRCMHFKDRVVAELRGHEQRRPIAPIGNLG